MKITLKAARVNAGLTQAEAAKTIGIGVVTLIKWEKNPDRMPVYMQRQIADAYNLLPENIKFLPDN